MPTYELTYFDIPGGRAEAIRLAFHLGGIPFIDRRIVFAEFRELKAGFPFKAVPVLAIDGRLVSQSNSLCRYVGKLAGLYPSNDLQALYCDETMDAVEDLANAIGRTFGLQGEALKAAREELVAGRLTVYLLGLASLLERGGGEFFADRRLTVADLKVFAQVGDLGRGHLDHIATDVVERIAPSLARHHERLAADHRIAAWYAR